jgi:NodT family efflux transporter outer membrane factor (OMF) lipoprotein
MVWAVRVAARHWHLLPTLCLLVACELGPDYTPPHPALPANWTEQHASAAQNAATLARLKQWWRAFHDPELDRLVDQAMAGNLDLAIARQRLMSSRAELVVAGAAAYPQIGAATMGGLANSSTTLQYPPGNGEYRTYSLGFDASWELDVFGGTKRAEEAAAADVQASIEDRRAILVSLLAELATDYATLRATQQRIAINQRATAVARRALDLTATEFDRGLTTSLAVAEARAQVELVQAALPPLRGDVARLTHAIAVLLGRLPGELEAELTAPGAAIPTPPDLPLTLPSEVVANRPDIARAERRLAAATSRIGAAIAQRYPHFTIPLTLEPTSSYLGELFQGASLVWSIGLSATAPVYQGGRLRAREDEARATAETAALTYRQTVLTALREVEDALVTYLTDTQRGARLQAAVTNDLTAEDQARRLYEAGLTDFLNVLTTERTLYSAQDQQALSELARLRQLIALYKALGGGWQAVDFGDETAKASAGVLP